MSLLLSHLVGFGPYVFDLHEGRLTRGNQSVDLPPRSVAVLSYLIQHRDHTVSREELKANLWPEIHIAPNSIHKQVSDLRLALGEEATYIETQYKKGWRFVADVKPAISAAIPLLSEAETVTVPVESVPVPIRKRWPAVSTIIITAAALCAVGLLVAIAARDGKVAVLNYQQLTNDGRHKREPLLTDGERIFFVDEFGGHDRIVSIPVSGGESTPLRFPSWRYNLVAISPDRRTLLVQSTDPEQASLWTLPTNGGEPKRLMAVGGPADWSPDGRTLAVAADRTNELVFHDIKDAGALRSVTVGGSIRFVRWSPDGKRVRLTVFDKAAERNSIWEVDVRPQTAGRVEALSQRVPFVEGGSWSIDGRYFFFQSGVGLQRDLWAASDARWLPNFVQSKPVALTQGFGSWLSPVSLPDGSGVAAIRLSPRSALASFNSDSQTWQPMWDQAPAYELDYSRDGQWIAYTRIPDHTIWKCRIDGSARSQLTDSSLEAHQPHWSADGRRIAFMGKTPTGKWRVNVVSAAGGAREEVRPTGEDQGVPTWSADGGYVVLGDRLGRSEGSKMSIHIMDVATGDLADLENAHGLWSPRWSPDGKMIAALTSDSRAIRVRGWPGSGAGTLWKEIARMQFMDNAMWSADSKYLYFTGRERTLEDWFYRVNVATSKLERLADLSHFAFAQEGWFGVSPDGTLLAAQSLSSEEIWALKLHLP
jgi:Tol biopolymer transport system component/DNA-binding winged helix-turn-helix (wHTH) protein